MKKHLLLSFLLCTGFYLLAQINASATANNGSGYAPVRAAGLDIENPDCEHSDFGPHRLVAYIPQSGYGAITAAPPGRAKRDSRIFQQQRQFCEA